MFTYPCLMPRTKLIPDQTVFDEVLHMLETGGDKAVAFSTVARATGLAAATLVQRFGSRDGMVQAALGAAWDRADCALAEAEAALPKSPKAASQLLKLLPDTTVMLAASQRDAGLRVRATQWRNRVEAALSLRLGGDAKAGQKSAMIFALWQGQSQWAGTGGKSFRLKDALKRLT